MAGYMHFFTEKWKRIGAILLCALLLGGVIYLDIPKDVEISMTGRASGEEPVSLCLKGKLKRRLFTAPVFSGTITADGTVYDVESLRLDGKFHPLWYWLEENKTSCSYGRAASDGRLENLVLRLDAGEDGEEQIIFCGALDEDWMRTHS